MHTTVASLIAALQAVAQHLAIDDSGVDARLCPAGCKAVDDALVWRVHDCHTGDNYYVSTLCYPPRSDERAPGTYRAHLLDADDYQVAAYHSGEWDFDASVTLPQA